MPRLLSTTLLACLVAAAPPAEAGRSAILPGTIADVLATVRGNALTGTDQSLPDAIVRLRDARYGRIVDTAKTDATGLFEFRPVDPGSYVVELVAADRIAVLAASQVLNVEAREIVTTLVRMPTGEALAALFGNTRTSAAAVLSEAALAGVLVVQSSGVATCDVLQ